MTHRIVARTGQGYVTKGDANNAQDSGVVPPGRVEGRVIGSIPAVGRGITALRTPLGMTLVVLTGLLLIEGPCLLRRRRPGEEAQDG